MKVAESTSDHHSITVCIPAYNEEAAIAATVADCVTELGRIPGWHTILVVDDGSTDGTGEILRELQRTYEQLRVLVHPENRGIGQAQRLLIQQATGDIIFHLSADGEWRAGEIHGMLETLAQGYDIVIGVRRKKCYGMYRLMLSWAFNLLVWLLFGQNFRDIGSIRIARASVWKRIPAQADSAFLIAEKLLLGHRNGARVGFTTVEHSWRSTGESKFGNPLRAIEAFGDLFAFWLSPRSRSKIDLWSEEGGGHEDPQVS